MQIFVKIDWINHEFVACQKCTFFDAEFYEFAEMIINGYVKLRMVKEFLSIIFFCYISINENNKIVYEDVPKKFS